MHAAWRRALLILGRRQPWSFLAPLVLAQVIGVTAFALSVPRNSWLFYHGGDQLWYATTGWLLVHGEMPIAHVGYGWALALAPFTTLSDGEFLGVLPPVILLNVLVFGPLATVGMYGLGARIGGRALGYLTAAIWVAAPFAAIVLTLSNHYEVIVEQFLPQVFGLTSQADFPSLVVLVGAAYFTLLAIQDRNANAAVLAGLLAGLALAFKPSNLLFLAGVALACGAASRLREAAFFTAGLTPSLLVLTLWKVKGLGEIPIGASASVHLASGTLAATPFDRYGDFDWALLRSNISGVQEVFRGGLLVLLAPLVGGIALARRSYPAALLFAGWLAPFLLVKGSSQFASTDDGSFFRLMTPSLPAYVVLSALALPLLIERGSFARRRAVSEAAVRVGRRSLVAAAVATGLLPFVVVLIADPIDGPERAVRNGNTLVPVNSRIVLEAERDRSGVTLRWTDPVERRSRTFYVVYRGAAGSATVCPSVSRGATDCELSMTPIAATRTRSWRDRQPPRAAEYRVAVAANWVDDPEQGDTFVVSGPQVSAATP